MHVDSHPSLSNRLAGGLLGIAMLLLIHRYWGIDHDATLYLGESLRQRLLAQAPVALPRRFTEILFSDFVVIS